MVVAGMASASWVWDWQRRRRMGRYGDLAATTVSAPPCRQGQVLNTPPARPGPTRRAEARYSTPQPAPQRFPPLLQTAWGGKATSRRRRHRLPQAGPSTEYSAGQARTDLQSRGAL